VSSERVKRLAEWIGRLHSGRPLFALDSATDLERSLYLEKAEELLPLVRERERTHLFNVGIFGLHSGGHSSFKVDCDALTDRDWKHLARVVASGLSFRDVIGIPSGGTKFAKALREYCSTGKILIVDDVLTTGDSMQHYRERLGEDTIGIVVFARGPFQDWIHPIFTLAWEGQLTE